MVALALIASLMIAVLTSGRVSRAATACAAIVIVLILAPGCATVVRDPKVYREQMEWFGHAVANTTQGPLDRARAHALAGDMPQCEAIAESVLVWRVTAPWQVMAALHLGDLAPHPGPSPEVPTAAAWCMERHLSGNDASTNPPAPPFSEHSPQTIPPLEATEPKR